MVFLFLGPSGSGKDTQAHLLSEVLDIPVTGTGELMRREVESGSDLGKEVGSFMQSGQWVPDDLVIQILRSELLKPKYKNGFIITGYPRRVSQVEPLESLLRGLGKTIDRVVHFDLSDEESLNRMRQQAKETKRDDESEEAMKGRLESYAETIDAILQEYEKRGKLLRVDAAPSVEKIHKDLRQKLEI